MNFTAETARRALAILVCIASLSVGQDAWASGAEADDDKPAVSPEPGIDMKVVHRIKIVRDEKWNPYAYCNPAQLDKDPEWEFVMTCSERFTRAYDWDGTLLWERTDPKGVRPRNVWHEVVTPTWDLDGDGIDEVITFGRVDGKHMLLALDGATGKIKYQFEHKQPTKDLRAIVYYPRKDDKPYIAMAGGDNLNRVLILDAKLNLVTQAKTPDATHHLFYYDMNGDGTHELVAGRYVIDINQKRRRVIWDMRKLLPSHADALMVADVIKDQPGPELFICDNRSLTLLINIPSRKVLWSTEEVYDNNDTLIAELDGKEGYELLTKSEHGRVNHAEKKTYFLDPKTGKVTDPNCTWPPAAMMAVDIDGDRDATELLTYHANLRRYPKMNLLLPLDWFRRHRPDSNAKDWHPYPIVTDLIGDSREEIVMWGVDEIVVGQNVAKPQVKLGKSWKNDREYNLRVRNRCLNRASQFFDYRKSAQ
ncbi:MAG: hypothetical protein ACLFVH_11175 [Phycisphaerae bacterium]